MKNLFFCLLTLTFFAACDCNEDDVVENLDVPACVKAIYEPGPTQDTHLIAVKKMAVGEGFHYWLNTGDIVFDGPEYIVNETCDTVCSFCFCPPDPCLENYQNGEWETIWQK